MDGKPLRDWPKALGGALALLLLLSLLSFDLQDPTLTNLRMPSGGIANWLSLPGALIGGSLLELLGGAALAAPLLVLNWTLATRARPAPHRYGLWCACLLLALSGLHGLAVAPVQPGLLDPGLAGWSVRHWRALTTDALGLGPWPAVALLAIVGGTALSRVVYAPAVRVALRDARLFAGWLLRESRARWRSSRTAMARRAHRMQRVAGATALGLTHGARLGVGGAAALLLGTLLAPPRLLAEWIGELRAPSLGRIKSRARGERSEPFAGLAAATAPESEEDGFARWFAPADTEDAASLPERSEARLQRLRARPARLGAWLDTETAEQPAAPLVAEPAAPPAAEAQVPPPAPASPPALGETDYRFERPEAEAAWRERFQRYARNLDLDWEEQLWRRQEDERDAGSDASAEPEP